jgi:hypothetical protein
MLVHVNKVRPRKKSGHFVVGQKVEARWGGKKTFYTATIMRQRKRKFSVLFDDNTLEDDVDASCLRHLVEDEEANIVAPTPVTAVQKTARRRQSTLDKFLSADVEASPKTRSTRDNEEEGKPSPPKLPMKRSARGNMGAHGRGRSFKEEEDTCAEEAAREPLRGRKRKRVDEEEGDQAAPRRSVNRRSPKREAGEGGKHVSSKEEARVQETATGRKRREALSQNTSTCSIEAANSPMTRTPRKSPEEGNCSSLTLRIKRGTKPEVGVSKQITNTEKRRGATFDSTSSNRPRRR